MSHLSVETIERLLDGDLGPDEQLAAEAHLADCAACRRELAALAALFAELGALPPEAPPVDLRPLVLARVAPPQWGLRAWALLLAQAAMVLALGLFLAPLLRQLLSGFDLPQFAPPEIPLPAWLSEPSRWWELLASGEALPAFGLLEALPPAAWASLIGAAALIWLLLNGYLLRIAAAAGEKRGR